MPIPAGTKFHGVAPSVDTVDRGGATVQPLRDVYTIEEISSAGTSDVYTLGSSTDGDNVDLNLNAVSGVDSTVQLTAGSGTHDLTLPSAAAIPYRVLRIVNNGTVTAQDKVDVYAPGSETIDGQASYRINKVYNGIAVWSDGNNWIVIQAKST